MPTTVIEAHDEFQRNWNNDSNINEWLHPDGFKAEGVNSSTLDMLGRIGTQIQTVMAYEDERKANRHPEHTKEHHAKVMKKRIGDAVKKIDELTAKAERAVEGEIRSTMATLDEDANLNLNKDWVSTVTGAFYGLKLDKKMEAIGQMIEAGQGPMLAILIDSPEFVTGLNTEQRQSIRRRVHEKVSPNTVRTLDALKRAQDRLDRSKQVTFNGVQKLYSGLSKYDAQIAKADALAKREPSASFAE